jgi:hypothetical protein
MGRSGSRPVAEEGRATGTADLTASVLLLTVALLLGLVGGTAIWLEAGLLTTTSGPSVPPMCAFELVIDLAVPVLSLAIVVGATTIVAYRRRRRLPASPAAAIAVGSVALVCVIAVWIAYAGASLMCHP